MAKGAYVDRWLYIPRERMRGRDKVKQSLTVQPIWFNKEEPKPNPIPMYDESVPGYLGVPIAWGLSYASKWKLKEVEDMTSDGRSVFVNKFPDPDHPLGGGEDQAVFMQDLQTAAEEYFAFTAKAGTGTGKTVCALWLAGKLGRNTLVIVPSTQLVSQWRDEITKQLGVSRSRIGIIQGDRCEYDKDFVLATVQTVVNRDFSEEVRRTFGFVVWDECHRMGAETFSRSIGAFSSRYKMAMTATDNRKDGAYKVCSDYFGKKAVEFKGKTLPCLVKVVNHRAAKPWGKDRTGIIKCLQLDTARNRKIVKLVAKLWDSGRYILVTGDGVKHLQTLQCMLIREGIPAEVMGQFTASYYPQANLQIAGDKNRAESLSRWAERSRTTPNEYLERIKKDNSVEIVFATYGSMKEGQDIPRLDAGIDVTPRTEGVQVIGRIRRKREGKPRPVWYTIRDTAFGMLLNYTEARIRDYKSSGDVEIIDYGVNGKADRFSEESRAGESK